MLEQPVPAGQNFLVRHPSILLHQHQVVEAGSLLALGNTIGYKFSVSDHDNHPFVEKVEPVSILILGAHLLANVEVPMLCPLSGGPGSAKEFIIRID